MSEIWRDIRGLTEVYQISNFGNLRSLDRTVMHRGRNRKLKGRILQPSIDISGYPRAGLRIEGKTIYVFVHRLVAEAFISNPKKLPCVDHINGVRTDNNVANLRWVNRSQNTANRHTTKQKTGHACIRHRPACTKNPYEVSGSIGGKSVIIGYFESLNHAVNARQKHLEGIFHE